MSFILYLIEPSTKRPMDTAMVVVVIARPTLLLAKTVSNESLWKDVAGDSGNEESSKWHDDDGLVKNGTDLHRCGKNAGILGLSAEIISLLAGKKRECSAAVPKVMMALNPPVRFVYVLFATLLSKYSLSVLKMLNWVNFLVEKSQIALTARDCSFRRRRHFSSSFAASFRALFVFVLEWDTS